MSIISNYKSYKKHAGEYDNWRYERDLKTKKTLEYINKNPKSISEEQVQKNKALLRAVDLMDEFTYKKTENLEVITGSVMNLALEYAAIGGAALGFLATKLNFVKKIVNKISKNNNRTVNLLNTSITTLTAIGTTILAFPIYNWASKAENKAFIKARQEVMQKELSNPKIFATLTPEQEFKLEKNIENTKKPNIIKKTYKSFKEKIQEIKKHTTETKEEIKNKNFIKQRFSRNNKKDFVINKNNLLEEDKKLVINLIDKINVASRDYQEKAEIVTNIAITTSFALGSLIALGYERLAKSLKININALPANFGLFLMLGTTLLAASLQKKAEHIGRFKIKQELIKNPEQLTYITDEKTGEIKDIDINKNKITTLSFLKNILIDYIEYEKWEKETFSKEKNLDNAFRDIEINENQLEKAKNLQNNTFLVFSKLDENTQKHAESINVIGQAIQYPIALLFNSLAGIFGVKHLTKLAKAINKKEIFLASTKYISTILALSTPSILINTKIIKEHKKALGISDMLTIKDLENKI